MNTELVTNNSQKIIKKQHYYTLGAHVLCQTSLGSQKLVEK
jgi:hypothetical protein